MRRQSTLLVLTTFRIFCTSYLHIYVIILRQYVKILHTCSKLTQNSSKLLNSRGSCDKCLSVSRVPKEFILYYMRAHRRCLLIIVILLLFSAYELYVKWTELTPLPIVVENVVFLQWNFPPTCFCGKPVPVWFSDQKV